MTWADLVVAERLWALSDKDDPLYTKFVTPGTMDQERRATILSDHPFLRDLADRVAAVPAVKKWLSQRPSNDQEPF